MVGKAAMAGVEGCDLSVDIWPRLTGADGPTRGLEKMEGGNCCGIP